MAHIKGKKKPSKFFFQPPALEEIKKKACTNHAASLDETDDMIPYKCFHCGYPMSEREYEEFFRTHGYRLKKRVWSKKWDYRKVGTPLKSFDQLLEGYTY